MILTLQQIAPILRKTITKTIVMMSYRMGNVVDKFAVAIKHAMAALPKEKLVEYFAETRDIDLQEILSVCEQMEEYELCTLIVEAQNKRNLIGTRYLDKKDAKNTEIAVLIN